MSATSSTQSTSGDSPPDRSRTLAVRHRPAWILFVVLGAIVCLAMGYWQLARFQSVSGSVQNLGYTFMWPFMAGFLVYVYFRYIKLEAEDAADKAADKAEGNAGIDGAHDEANDPAGEERARRLARERRRVVTAIPEDILPTRKPLASQTSQDEGLRVYNDYLAELARQDSTTEENTHR